MEKREKKSVITHNRSIYDAMTSSNCPDVDLYNIEIYTIIISGTNPVSQSNRSGITESSIMVITHL